MLSSKTATFSRLPPLVVLSFLSFGCTGGDSNPHSKDQIPEAHSKIDEIKLREGMPKHEVIQLLGEPDYYESEVIPSGLPPESDRYGVIDIKETLKYAPFGAYSQTEGDVTRHRLNLTFTSKMYTRGKPPKEIQESFRSLMTPKLDKWSKDAPIRGTSTR